jgi:hypothetical protein
MNRHCRRYHGDALLLLVPDLDNHFMIGGTALPHPI